jgi:hypothetical protein
MREMMRLKPAAEVTATLMDVACRTCAQTGKAPAAAYVAIAQLDYLKATGQKTQYDSLLERALANPDVSPDDLNAIKVYKALSLRRAGKTDDGLAMLQGVAPKLQFADADATAAARLVRPIAPFTVSKDGTVLGVVSSDVVPDLAGIALGWLNGLEGGLPVPDGLDADSLAKGTIALVAVLNRPGDAAPWVQAWRAKLGSAAFANRADSVFAEGVLCVAQGRLKKGSDDLVRVLTAAPWLSFAQYTGVLSYEALVKARDRNQAALCQKFMDDVFGPRLLDSYRARLR